MEKIVRKIIIGFDLKHIVE